MLPVLVIFLTDLKIWCGDIWKIRKKFEGLNGICFFTNLAYLESTCLKIWPNFVRNGAIILKGGFTEILNKIRIIKFFNFISSYFLPIRKKFDKTLWKRFVFSNSSLNIMLAFVGEQPRDTYFSSTLACRKFGIHSLSDG